MFCTKCGKELPDGSAFCTNCGAKIASEFSNGQAQKSDPPQPETASATESHRASKTPDGIHFSQQQTAEQSAAIASNTGSEETHSEAVMQQIVGKNAEYYLTQFVRMRQGAKSKINWASFFLGIGHASYRNVWREWLKAVRLPLILSIGLQVLGVLLLQIQFILGIVVECLSIPVSIWFWVAALLLSKRFNQIYMRHVEDKVARHDLKPDPSIGRAILTWFVSWIAYMLLMSILSSLLMSALIGAFSGADEQILDDMVPNQEIVDSIEPISPETDDSLDSQAYAINMNDYVGSWMVDRYNSYMDGFVGFTIENNNDQFYFSANGVWNQGDRVTNIEYAQIELNYEGTQAGGYYEDDRGNTGDIILDFEDGELYLTVTVDGSGNYSFAMSHEHCTRDYDTAGNISEPGNTPQTQSYKFYHENHTYSNEMDGLGGYTIGEDHLWPTDTLTITDADLNELTRMEVAAIRNEIYARHGYTFSSQEWADFFATATWYVPNAAFSNDMLNTTEKQNAETIVAYEKARGWNQ